MNDAIRPASSISLGPLEKAVSDALETLKRQDVVRRVWQHDHTVWSDDPTEITQPNRLGWLDIAGTMAGEVSRLQAFAREVAGEDYGDVVLLGMGGSSLAPEVLQHTFSNAAGMPRLQALDTTHPDSVLEVRKRLDLDKTLFIVASKSGSTIETLSHFHYFWGETPHGKHFVAITDEGSLLQKLGEERGFRRVFLNNPDIGGRYSALSYFGLVPGALIGVDLDALVSSARDMAEACKTSTAIDNPGALLGALIAAGASAGRDKLTLLLADEVASFGDWVEQLIAESTGKEGRGIVPVVGEPLSSVDAYGLDRVFVCLGEDPRIAGLERDGQPVLRLPFDGASQLGAEFYRWEFATAVAGSLLRINPFDQPNVQSAKDATSRILEAGDVEAPATSEGIEDFVSSSLRLGDYIALLAYLPRNDAVEQKLQSLRRRLGERYGVATTLGFGPRYLHSTGQLHKGGQDEGVFILLTDDAEADAEIPGRPYTFDRLRRAQALGDLQSLRSLQRRAAYVHLQGERLQAIEKLEQQIS
jgi:transaldolase / glucose-6-phosphate isomerase